METQAHEAAENTHWRGFRDAKVAGEEAMVVRAAREDSTDATSPSRASAAQKQRFAGAAAFDGRRRAEVFSWARVSKIRVSPTKITSVTSPAATPATSTGAQDAFARLEHSLKLSESPRVFQASRVYVALVWSDAIVIVAY